MNCQEMRANAHEHLRPVPALRQSVAFDACRKTRGLSPQKKEVVVPVCCSVPWITMDEGIPLLSPRNGLRAVRNEQ